jgi:protein CpxP
MRATLKLVVVLAALAIVAGMVGVSIPAAAQGTAQDAVKATLQKISEALNLTDDQKEKLRPILQEEVDKMKAVRDDTSLTPDQKKAKLREIHEAYRPKVNDVLTPEQQAKWQKMKEEAKEKMKEDAAKN